MRTSSSASRRPTTARSTSSRIRSATSPTSETFTGLDRLADGLDRQAGPVGLRHLVRALAHQLVGRVTEQRPRLVRVALEVDAAPLVEALERDLAQYEPQPLAVGGRRE